MAAGAREQTLDKHQTNWGVYYNIIRKTITIRTCLLNSWYATLAVTWLTVAIASTPDLTNKFWSLSNLKSPQLSRRLNLSGGYYVTVLRHRCFVNIWWWWPLQNNNCANPYHNFHKSILQIDRFHLGLMHLQPWLRPHSAEHRKFAKLSPNSGQRSFIQNHISHPSVAKHV